MAMRGDRKRPPLSYRPTVLPGHSVNVTVGLSEIAPAMGSLRDDELVARRRRHNTLCYNQEVNSDRANG